MLISAPKSPREVFETFRLYDSEVGIDGLLSSIDFSNMSRRQVYWAVLGRFPESARNVPPNYDVRLHYKAGLFSQEFQHDLLSLLLDAYPDKRRLVFVHVPKCAGSDVTSLLTKRYPSFNMRLTERPWYEGERLFVALKKLVDEISYSGDIFIFGHTPLRTFLSEGTVRHGDRSMALVRNPFSMVVSAINYILMRYKDDTEAQANDTRDWLTHLDHDRIKRGILAPITPDLANYILRNTSLIEPNRICKYLGAGTAESAFEACARADIEIAHVNRYRDWLSTQWGIASTTSTNASQPLVSKDLFDADMLLYAKELNSEDEQFVGIIEKLLENQDRCFVRGSEF